MPKKEEFNHPNHTISLPSSIDKFDIITRSVKYDATDKVKGYDDGDEDECGCTPFLDPDTNEMICCVDDHCMNFSTQLECISCNTSCHNNRFQRSNYINLYVKETPGKGHGLFPSQRIHRHEFIMEYVGELVSSKEILRRLSASSSSASSNHLYVMQLQANTYLDARSKGSISRYINHSCEPNCTIEIWTIAGHVRVGIFALHDIMPHDELSFDYQWRTSSKRKPTICLCKTSTCRGHIEVDVDKQQDMMIQDDIHHIEPEGRVRPKADAIEIILSSKQPEWLIGKVVRVHWDGNLEFFKATVKSINYHHHRRNDGDMMTISDDMMREITYECFYYDDESTTHEKLLSLDAKWEWCDTTQTELSIKKRSDTMDDEEEDLETIPIIPLHRPSFHRHTHPRTPVSSFSSSSSSSSMLPLPMLPDAVRVFKTLERSVVNQLMIHAGMLNINSLSQYMRRSFNITVTIVCDTYADKTDYAFTGTSFSMEQLEKCLSDATATLRQRVNTKQQEYLHHITSCQAHDSIIYDWRLRYPPIRSWILQHTASTPTLSASILSSYHSTASLAVGVLPLSVLMIYYQHHHMMVKDDALIISREQREQLLQHLQGVLIKLECRGIVYIHAMTMMMRYASCGVLHDEVVVKEVFAPIAAAIIVAYKALGQFQGKSYQKIVLATCSQTFHRPEKELLKNSDMSYFLKRVAYHEARLLQALDYDVFVPYPFPQLLSSISSSSSISSMMEGWDGYCDDACMMLLEVICHASEVYDLYPIDNLLLACLRIRLSHASSTSSSSSMLHVVDISCHDIMYHSTYVKEAMSWIMSLIEALTQAHGGTNFSWYHKLSSSSSMMLAPPPPPPPSSSSPPSSYTTLPAANSRRWRYRLPILSSTSPSSSSSSSSSLKRHDMNVGHMKKIWKDYYETNDHDHDDDVGYGIIYRLCPPEGHRLQAELKRRSQVTHTLGCSWMALAELQVLAQLQYYHHTKTSSSPSSSSSTTTSSSSSTPSSSSGDDYMMMSMRSVQVLEERNQIMFSYHHLKQQHMIVSSVAKMVSCWKADSMMECCTASCIKRWCYEIVMIIQTCSNSGIYFQALTLDHFLITSSGHLLLGDYTNATFLPSLSSSTTTSSSSSSSASEPSSSKRSSTIYLSSGTIAPEVILGSLPNASSNLFIAGAIMHQLVTLGKPVSKPGTSEEKHLSYLYCILGTPMTMGWMMTTYDSLPYAHVYPRQMLKDVAGAGDSHLQPCYTESKCRIMKMLRNNIPPHMISWLSPPPSPSPTSTSISAASSFSSSSSDNQHHKKEKKYQHRSSTSSSEDKDISLPAAHESDNGHICDVLYRALHLVPSRRPSFAILLQMPFFTSISSASMNMMLTREMFHREKVAPMVITPSPPTQHTAETSVINDRNIDNHNHSNVDDHPSPPSIIDVISSSKTSSEMNMSSHKPPLQSTVITPAQPTNIIHAAQKDEAESTPVKKVASLNMRPRTILLNQSSSKLSTSSLSPSPSSNISGAKRHFQNALRQTNALNEGRPVHPIKGVVTPVLTVPASPTVSAPISSFTSTPNIMPASKRNKYSEDVDIRYQDSVDIRYHDNNTSLSHNNNHYPRDSHDNKHHHSHDNNSDYYHHGYDKDQHHNHKRKNHHHDHDDARDRDHNRERSRSRDRQFDYRAGICYYDEDRRKSTGSYKVGSRW